MKRIVETQLRRMLSLFLVLSMCVGQSYAAEATATTVQLMKTEGTVDVTNSGGRALTVREDMRLYNGYHVNTGAKSYAWVNLDSDKLTKLDESSEMELRKEKQKLEVLLNEGSIYFNVEKPLEDSESMNIRTSTMVVGIRGTCGWVRVIDRWTTEVSVLEGSVQCTVTDPVSGQIKTTIVKGGEKAVFVVYDPARAGDKCDILRDHFTEEDIPGFVLVELVRDTPLCEKIYADSGLDLLPITREEAENRLKADQAEQEKRLEEREHLVAEQERHVSVDPVWKGDTPVSPDDSSGGGGGGTSSGPSGVIRLTMPVTAREVQNYLDTPAVTGVTLLPGSGNNTFSVDIAMTVPSGKTLTLNAGVPARVEAGNSMTVNGTAGLNDALTNLGTVTVNSANTLRVGGNLTNNSTMIVPATGRSITEGTFTNNQTLTLTAGAQVLARTFDLAAPVAGWTVTGPQSDGYYRLVQTQPPHTITFDGEGSTGTTGEDGTLSNLPVLPPNENGDEFDGWYTQPDGGGKKVTEDTIFTEDTTLYPHWTTPSAGTTYTITRVYNDGSGGSDTVTTLDDGKLVANALEAPASTIEGIEFTGWFTAQTDGTQVTTSTVFTSDATIYAHWKALAGSYTITFDKNSPDGSESPTSTINTDESGRVPSGDWYTPTFTGYTFLGWFTAMADGEGTKVTVDYAFTQDTTVYAHWVKNIDATISGTVTRPATESTPASPVGGATVRLLQEESTTSRAVRAATRTEIASITTDSRYGTYTLKITNVPPGTYILTADAPGFTTKHEVTLAEGIEVYTEDFTLSNAWDYNETTKTLTIGGAGPMADYDTSYDAANQPWYSWRTEIKNVVLTDGVTSIGRGAFQYCTSLTNITIQDSVTSIGSYAFRYCSSLTNITIPDSVTSIGNYAFYGCNGLTSVNIPSDSKLTSIGKEAFYLCVNLTGITIPARVTSIEDDAFSSCTGLTNVTVDADNTAYCSADGVLFNKDKTKLILHPRKKTGSSYTIPNSVTSIGVEAFYSCSSLTSITIPDSVTSIGSYAFRNCSALTDITIPASVEIIGSTAFSGCTSLTSVAIPDSVTSIESSTFSRCSALTSITIPDSVTSIGSYAFDGCTNLANVYYSGTEARWNTITIGSNNNRLTNATKHWESTGPDAG